MKNSKEEKLLFDHKIATSKQPELGLIVERNSAKELKDKRVDRLFTELLRELAVEAPIKQ